MHSKSIAACILGYNKKKSDINNLCLKTRNQLYFLRFLLWATQLKEIKTGGFMPLHFFSDYSILWCEWFAIKKNCILNHYYYERFPKKRYYLLLLLIKLTICFKKVVKNLTTSVGCFLLCSSWFGIRFDLFSIKTIVAATFPGLFYHFYTTTSSKRSFG